MEGRENSWNALGPIYDVAHLERHPTPSDLMRRFRPSLRLAAVFALLASALVLPAAAADERSIDTAEKILSLTIDEAAKRLPISVRGVVTAAEPDWSGQFFVQDETGGVFVENLTKTPPAIGDLVHVHGVSHPGAFAPIVSSPSWEHLGVAPLPAPKRVLIESLQLGQEDGLRVEVAGIVRTVRVENARLKLELAVGGFRLEVFTRLPPVGDPQSLVAARVRVRGTAATHYNAALRHLTSVAVYSPTPEDFAVLEPAPPDPFAQPTVPIQSVAQYRHDAAPAGRLHVRGRVTLQRRGEDLFLEDATGGIRISTTQPADFPAGSLVDAVGFLEFHNHLPVLRDSSVRQADKPASPVAPREAKISDLQRGLHHAQFVTLRGRLLDRASRRLERREFGVTVIQTTCVMQGEGLIFMLEHESEHESPALADIPLGSTIAVDGVCFSDVELDGKLRSLRLLVPPDAHVRVLAKPGWFTPARLLIGIALLSALLLGALLWTLTVSKKNAALRSLIRKLETAQRELQEAHDTLEQKVAERSAQLQVQMTERHEAELQFKAVLAERTRLARDLHDSLEQTLAGIALQLDTAAKLFDRTPENSRHHLQLARNWIRQSQVELRRSIWDLRSRELEQFDIATALRQSAEHLVDGTGTTVSFASRGERYRLPEIVEENVLRIGQEALTNIAKHARASHIDIAFDFTPQALVLRVTDDGQGFALPTVPSASDSHFGLLGMQERAKRISARLRIESTPGRGTVVTVEVPFAAPDAAARPDASTGVSRSTAP